MIDLNMCGQMKADGKRCLKKCATGDTMCSCHRSSANRRERKRRADVLLRDAVQVLWSDTPPREFTELSAPTNAAMERGWIDQLVAIDVILRLEEEWLWFQRDRVGPTVEPKTELKRLAFDNQNVHTKEVNAQTTETQEFLLKTLVPKGQDTLVELESAWYEKDTKKVMKDIRMYYKLLDNDHLYQRVLDGLWAHIQEHPHRSELIERLWEEATESVTKCYHGHMSRLSNVLVGFTEEVKADIPVGEILQQKIAVIAEKEIPTTHKVGEAWVVFEELHIPMVERDAWIEAL